MQIYSATSVHRPATSQSRPVSEAPEPKDEFVPGERTGLETVGRMNAGFFVGAACGAICGAALNGDARLGALVGGGAGALVMAWA